MGLFGSERLTEKLNDWSEFIWEGIFEIVNKEELIELVEDGVDVGVGSFAGEAGVGEGDGAGVVVVEVEVNGTAIQVLGLIFMTLEGIYLLGLAGDTTTPDITTEVWEADYPRPTTPGQHNLDITGKACNKFDFGGFSNIMCRRLKIFLYTYEK